MNKAIFAQYAALNETLATLEKEKEVLRTQILESLTKENTLKAETEYGTFTRASRASWVYSERIKEMNEKLKIAKTKEENNGKAKKTMTEYLVFSTPKV